MIINKIDNNNYIIKIINTTLDIYKPNILEEITTKIIKLLEFYKIKEYGIIILLKSIKTLQTNNETEVKITIHTDYPALYKIDYNLIKENNLSKNNIYYYKDNFYLEIKNTISKKDYLYLLELSEITYKNTLNILNYGLKIKL